MISAHDRFNGVYITGTGIFILFLGAGLFYLGMTPIAEYFTGQRTITMWSRYGSRIPLNRDEHFCVFLYLVCSLFFLFGGVLAILFFDRADWLSFSRHILLPSDWTRLTRSPSGVGPVEVTSAWVCDRAACGSADWRHQWSADSSCRSLRLSTPAGLARQWNPTPPQLSVFSTAAIARVQGSVHGAQDFLARGLLSLWRRHLEPLSANRPGLRCCCEGWGLRKS